VTAVQTVPPPSPQGDAPRRRRRHWLAAAVALWAVLLVGLAYLSVRQDAPTVPEQRDIAAASQVVDRAVGALVAAVGEDAVVEMSAARLVAGCRVTPLREGATLERSVTVRTRPGAASAELDGIAHRLPPSFAATVRSDPGGSAVSLRADAGDFVAVRGSLAGKEVLTLTVASGCRPTSPGVDPLVQLLMGLPIDEEPVRVLKALGTTPRERVDRVGAPCPGRGAAYTARATARDAVQVRPVAALGPVADATVLADTSDQYVVRAGRRSLVVERVAGEVRVTVTDGCAR
jgi:hypothetical protein